MYTKYEPYKEYESHRAYKKYVSFKPYYKSEFSGESLSLFFGKEINNKNIAKFLDNGTLVLNSNVLLLK